MYALRSALASARAMYARASSTLVTFPSRISREASATPSSVGSAGGCTARREPAYTAGTYDDFDAWNARFVDRKTGVKTVDVLAELDASHRAFIAAAAALPDALLAPGEAAREAFEGAGAGHYREHATQIR